MKLLAITAASLSLITTVIAASCARQDNDGYTYIVKASGVDNIAGYCRVLWDSLRPIASCATSTATCGGRYGNLYWRFNVGKDCDGGGVQAAWSGATRDRFGSITCP